MKKINFLLTLIIIVNIILRLPSLFDPVSYGDECIYLVLGQAFNKGLVFYRDIHDNKPPLLYLMAALANGNLFWLRLITIVWNSFNIWLIYKVAKKLLKTEIAGLIAAFLFVIFALLPEGRIANGEIYMIMPATLGLLLTLIAYKKSYLWFLSGIAFSIAFLFKIPIAFDFVGLLIAIFLFPKKNLRDVFTIIKDKKNYLILAGFILPIFLSIIYYSLKGAFTPYVRSALMQNIGYLASWSGSKAGLYERSGILLLVTIILYLWRKQLGFSFYLAGLMTFFGLFGAFLSERPYPHYLIEIVPWLAILLTVLLWQRKISQLVVTILLIILIILGVNQYKFWWYPNIPYYQNFSKFITGRINKNDYFRFFGDKVNNDYQLAKLIKQAVPADDRVFIWGDGVCIYALSQRLPPGRYTVNYHIFDFKGFEETIKAIKEKQPPIIIKLRSEKQSFPQLEAILKTYYVFAQNVGDGKIYRQIVKF